MLLALVHGELTWTFSLSLIFMHVPRILSPTSQKPKKALVRFIYLDEISMVGNTMFNVQINNRLKDIKGSENDFGGVSIIAIGDLFQLQPVMDGYIFKDLDNLEYRILAPNLWQKHFKMFELHEIMRQREIKQSIC